MLQLWDVRVVCGDKTVREVRVMTNTVNMALSVAMTKFQELHPPPCVPLSVQPVMTGEI